MRESLTLNSRPAPNIPPAPYTPTALTPFPHPTHPTTRDADCCLVNTDVAHSEARAHAEVMPRTLVATDGPVSGVLVEAAVLPFLRGLDCLPQPEQRTGGAAASASPAAASDLDRLRPWTVPLESLGSRGRLAVAALALNVSAAVISASGTSTGGGAAPPSTIAEDVRRSLRTVAIAYASTTAAHRIRRHARHLHQLLCASKGADQRTGPRFQPRRHRPHLLPRRSKPQACSALPGPARGTGPPTPPLPAQHCLHVLTWPVNHGCGLVPGSGCTQRRLPRSCTTAGSRTCAIGCRRRPSRRRPSWCKAGGVAPRSPTTRCNSSSAF